MVYALIEHSSRAIRAREIAWFRLVTRQKILVGMVTESFLTRRLCLFFHIETNYNRETHEDVHSYMGVNQQPLLCNRCMQYLGIPAWYIKGIVFSKSQWLSVFVL